MDEVGKVLDDFLTWVFNPGYAVKRMIDNVDDMLAGSEGDER